MPNSEYAKCFLKIYKMKPAWSFLRSGSTAFLVLFVSLCYALHWVAILCRQIMTFLSGLFSSKLISEWETLQENNINGCSCFWLFSSSSFFLQQKNKFFGNEDCMLNTILLCTIQCSIMVKLVAVVVDVYRTWNMCLWRNKK